MLRRAIIAICLGAAGAAVAQVPEEAPRPQAEPAGGALAAVLSRARTSGALERLLVPRWFEDETGGVVRFACEPLQGGGLRCELAFLPVGAMREERTRLLCEVDATGSVRQVASESVRGQERHGLTGEVRDGRLALRLQPGDEAREAEWGPEVLPLPLLALVLAALADQGLPEAATARAFQGFAPAPEKTTTELRWKRSDAGWELTIGPLAEGQDASRIAADPSGAPREVVLSGLKLTPITAEEAARRLGTR